MLTQNCENFNFVFSFVEQVLYTSDEDFSEKLESWTKVKFYLIGITQPEFLFIAFLSVERPLEFKDVALEQIRWHIFELVPELTASSTANLAIWMSKNLSRSSIIVPDGKYQYCTSFME